MVPTAPRYKFVKVGMKAITGQEVALMAIIIANRWNLSSPGYCSYTFRQVVAESSRIVETLSQLKFVKITY